MDGINTFQLFYKEKQWTEHLKYIFLIELHFILLLHLASILELMDKVFALAYHYEVHMYCTV